MIKTATGMAALGILSRMSSAAEGPLPSTQALYSEAKSKNWSVISMKNDWKRIFAFEG